MPGSISNKKRHQRCMQHLGYHNRCTGLYLAVEPLWVDQSVKFVLVWKQKCIRIYLYKKRYKYICIKKILMWYKWILIWKIIWIFDKSNICYICYNVILIQMIIRTEYICIKKTYGQKSEYIHIKMIQIWYMYEYLHQKWYQYTWISNIRHTLE